MLQLCGEQRDTAKDIGVDGVYY